jgi:hypothetical protein
MRWQLAATVTGASPAACAAPSRAGSYLYPLNLDLGRRHPARPPTPNFGTFPLAKMDVKIDLKCN